MLERRPHVVPAVLAALFLFGALLHWPYGYYILLRWVVMLAAVWVVFCAWGWEKQWVAWAFAFVAILFNPLVPIHLTREIWQAINFIRS